MIFTLFEDEMGEHLLMEVDGVISSVPMVDGNSDYQAYLKSLEPEVVEEPVKEAPVEEAPVEETPVDVAAEKETT